jgi:hypothetical protein
VIKTTKDGRTIRKGASYTKFRVALHGLQCGACARCERMTSLTAPLEWDSSFHCHHVNGRGMGSSKRNDTAESCTGLCGSCHRKLHNQ